MKYILLMLLLALGCRHCPRHCEKPKIKQSITTRVESGTKLYAEGFGPNQLTKQHQPSPFECVELKGIMEYKLEW